MAVGSAARVRLRRHEQAASKLADHSNWQGGQAAQTNSLTGQRRNGRINSPIERQHSTAGRGAAGTAGSTGCVTILEPWDQTMTWRRVRALLTGGENSRAKLAVHSFICTGELNATLKDNSTTPIPQPAPRLLLSSSPSSSLALPPPLPLTQPLPAPLLPSSSNRVRTGGASSALRLAHESASAVAVMEGREGCEGGRGDCDEEREEEGGAVPSSVPSSSPLLSPAWAERTSGAANCWCASSLIACSTRRTTLPTTTSEEGGRGMRVGGGKVPLIDTITTGKRCTASSHRMHCNGLAALIPHCSCAKHARVHARGGSKLNRIISHL